MRQPTTRRVSADRARAWLVTGPDARTTKHRRGSRGDDLPRVPRKATTHSNLSADDVRSYKEDGVNVPAVTDITIDCGPQPAARTPRDASTRGRSSPTVRSRRPQTAICFRHPPFERALSGRRSPLDPRDQRIRGNPCVENALREIMRRILPDSAVRLDDLRREADRAHTLRVRRDDGAGIGLIDPRELEIDDPPSADVSSRADDHVGRWSCVELLDRRPRRRDPTPAAGHETEVRQATRSSAGARLRARRIDRRRGALRAGDIRRDEEEERERDVRQLSGRHESLIVEEGAGEPVERLALWLRERD